MHGELIIEETETRMMHAGVVFGTVRQTGAAGWRERWHVHVPSLRYSAEEKSRAVAEESLIRCYCGTDHK